MNSMRVCKRLRAKRIILHTIILGVKGTIYTSNTSHCLKEPGLDTQNARKTALNNMLALFQIENTHRRAFEK